MLYSLTYMIKLMVYYVFTLIGTYIMNNTINFKHGYTSGGTRHPLYRVLMSMNQRCTNIKDKGYKNYGGRGITVCYEWASDPVSFIHWAINHGWVKGLEIDRRDNNGDYSPKNCRFVPKVTNARNKQLLRSTNSSGFCGVSFHKATKKWAAKCRSEGKERWLGSYPTPEEAAKVRDIFVISNQLESPLNFPEEALS